VRRSYETLLSSDSTARFNGVGRYRETSRGLDDAWSDLDGVESLVTPRVRAIMEAYFGGHFEVAYIRAWRISYIAGLSEDTAVEAYSNQWHNDRFSTALVRFFVLLSDGVTRDTGAFRLHPIPSTKQIVRSGTYLRRDLVFGEARRALEDDSRVAYFEGDAGAACLANPQFVLHRAGIPRPGSSRDMLNFTFRPATKPLADDWIKHRPTGPLPGE
jgi:hypothetical protein